MRSGVSDLQKKKLPGIGARIIKSGVGVFICMLIYFLRGRSGMPFYSALAVLWCMRQYTKDTKDMAIQRIIGTFIGAAYGLAVLLVISCFESVNVMAVYCVCSLMIIPIIYTTVLLDKKNASFFSCVVFLSITITHSFDSNPYIFVLNRILDTLIGIAVGVALNIVNPHRKRDNDTLFISGIDAVLVSSNDTMLPYNKVELNRLISEGAKFTVSTTRTPASLLTHMSGVDLKLPVIAMDDAVLYDINENRYLEKEPLPSDISRRAEKIISDMGCHCFINALCDNTLLIYYGDLANEAEKNLYDTLRKSPYRNYTNIKFRTDNAEVLYLMVIDTDEKTEALYQALCDGDIARDTRINLSQSVEYPGYTYIKIYSKNASKKYMTEKLKKYTKAEKVITFGSVEGEYDIYIDDDGGTSAVKTLKKLYEG